MAAQQNEAGMADAMSSMDRMAKASKDLAFPHGVRLGDAIAARVAPDAAVPAVPTEKSVLSFPQEARSDVLPVRADVVTHPLFPILEAAILQAMYGKGQRHGGNVTPFLEQPWVHYSKMHGRAFLTGQAAKKLEEAASTRTGEGFETEVFGAIVYAGMSVLKDRGAV